MSPLRPVFTSRALLLVGALCAAGGVAAQTQEPAPALADNLAGLSNYPTTQGSDALRQAIAEWIARRCGVPLPDNYPVVGRDARRRHAVPRVVGCGDRGPRCPLGAGRARGGAQAPRRAFARQR